MLDPTPGVFVATSTISDGTALSAFPGENPEHQVLNDWCDETHDRLVGQGYGALLEGKVPPELALCTISVRVTSFSSKCHGKHWPSSMTEMGAHAMGSAERKSWREVAAETKLVRGS